MDLRDHESQAHRSKDTVAQESPMPHAGTARHENWWRIRGEWIEASSPTTSRRRSADLRELCTFQ